MNTTKRESSCIENIKIPIIVDKDIVLGKTTWKVYFYDEYAFQFTDPMGEWKNDFIVMLNEKVSALFHDDFRVALDYNSIPLLVAFFLDENKILICSHKASRELFLLENLENLEVGGQENESIEDKVSNDYGNLKAHINKILSINSTTLPTDIETITKLYDLPDLLNNTEYPEVNKVCKRISSHLVDELNRYKTSFFEKLTDYCLNLTANYAILRVHLLKFLAILPSLDYDHKGYDVKRIFLESIRRTVEDSQIAKGKRSGGDQRAVSFYLLFIFNLSAVFTTFLPSRLFAFGVRWVAISFARRFIAGETIKKSRASLGMLRSTGRDATIDQLGELVVSEKEADKYCSGVIKIIKGLASQIKRGDKNGAGILRANVSIKVSALSSDFKPEDPEYSYNSVAPRLKAILLVAKEEDVFINVDAEHYSCRDLIFNIFKRVLLENEEFKDFESVGIVVQAYLRDAYILFSGILELARLRKIIMPIRLVKGAYWDAETIEANAFNFNAPQFLNKEETDLHFRQLIIMIMKNYPHVQLCLASHNLHDHCFAEALRHYYFSDLPKIEHQCLYMTCESLSVSMVTMQWVTRNYVPIGNLLVGMGYLVRRIMENSSLVGILTIMRSHKKHSIIKEPDVLFSEKRDGGELVYDQAITTMSSDFSNVPPIRFYVKQHRDAVVQQVESFGSDIVKKYKNDMELHGELLSVSSPSNPETFVGQIVLANEMDIKAALEVSYNSIKDGTWMDLPLITRSSILLKAADSLLFRRVELAALIVFESGKSVCEAIADVDEAIDFLNYYAREELKFKIENQSSVPRGVFVVISPWNFPLAIPAGMVSAALVAGNSVLFKSSTQTPLIGQVLVDILHDSGVPKDVLIHVPGSGDNIGSVLVNNENVNGIVFTGSKRVGVWIANQAYKRVANSVVSDSVKSPVKVITEMGGKNAIIVTANAELDETVSGALYSCFGHAGQKCSAASRILVDQRILDRFIVRFKEACLDVNVGEAYKFSSTVNPIICQHDKERLITEGAKACEEAIVSGGQIVVNRLNDQLPGCCVGPLVILIPVSVAMSRESYAHKELFGPIIHVIPFKKIDQAIEIVNSSEYALTNGIFSQSQDDIEYITDRIEAGNLYVNRGCTGARVSIEPFGGFKHSGTGPKAGHHDYLNAFHLKPKDRVLQPIGENDDNLEDLEDNEKSVYKLARRSQLRMDKRLNIVKNIILSIDLNLKNVFEKIQDITADDLSMLADWLDENLEQFLYTRHYNRVIQGQLNYNDHSMIKEVGLLIADNNIPDKTTIYNLISALAIGCGVTVLARNRQAFAEWQIICDYCIDAGIHDKSLLLRLVDDVEMENYLENGDIGFVIIDGDINGVKRVLKTITIDENRKYMCSIHTLMDAPTNHNWRDYLLQFVYVRSLAINTMRHGAPLEVSLDA